MNSPIKPAFKLRSRRVASHQIPVTSLVVADFQSLLVDTLRNPTARYDCQHCWSTTAAPALRRWQGKQSPRRARLRGALLRREWSFAVGLIFFRRDQNTMPARTLTRTNWI